MTSSPGGPVLSGVRAIFRAVATTIVPEAARLDATGWDEVEATVERALAERPPAVRRQVVAFLKVIDLLPVARFGSRFLRLDDARRTRVLDSLQRSRLLPLRRGVWGVRTLVFMGYYTRAAAAGEIGYRASRLGWEARR